MGIKQLYNDNLRKLPNEYGNVSVMQTLIVCFMKLKLMTFMEIYSNIKNYLIIVITQKTVSSFLMKIKR